VAPLARCAELLGVDLATVRELAAEIEPYVRADGTRIWSRCSWTPASARNVSGALGRLPRPTTDPGRRCLINPGVGAHGIRAVKCDALRPS